MAQDHDDLPSDDEIRDLSARGRAFAELSLNLSRLRIVRSALERARGKEDVAEDLIELRLGDVRNAIDQVNRRIELLQDTFQATEAPGEDQVIALRQAVRALRKSVEASATGVELLTLAADALEDATPSA